MASDLTSIIAQLEQQRAAIDRALSALREIGGGGTAAPTPAKRRGRPPGSKNAGANPEVAAAPSKPAQKKRSGLTTAGRKRLSEMMKARWASKNPPKTKARA